MNVDVASQKNHFKTLAYSIENATVNVSFLMLPALQHFSVRVE